MQVIYFIAESEDKVTLEFLRSIGLGYAFDKKPVTRAVLSGQGPDGKSGCVIGRSVDRLGYYADRQTWQPLVGVENVWVGVDNAHPPTAAGMRRIDWTSGDALVIPSHPLTVGESIWQIPIARGWSLSDRRLVWSGSLPRKLNYATDESGNAHFQPGETLAKFERLEQLADTIQDHYFDSTLPDDYHQLCADILSTCYYIGPQEMAMIGMVDWSAQSAADLLFLVIDEPGLVEQLEKKTEHDLESASSGNAV